MAQRDSARLLSTLHTESPTFERYRRPHRDSCVFDPGPEGESVLDESAAWTRSVVPPTAKTFVRHVTVHPLLEHGLGSLARASTQGQAERAVHEAIREAVAPLRAEMARVRSELTELLRLMHDAQAAVAAEGEMLREMGLSPDALSDSAEEDPWALAREATKDITDDEWEAIREGD